MKANKKLLISAMALGLAGLTTVGSTYAWFAMNRTVTAEGMKLKATTSTTLLISNSSDVDSTKNNRLTNGGTSYTFTDDAVSLSPTSTVDGSKWFSAEAEDVDDKIAISGSYTEVDSAALDSYRLAKVVYVQNFDSGKTGLSGESLIISNIKSVYSTGDKISSSLRVLAICNNTKLFVAPLSATVPTNQGVQAVDNSGNATLADLVYATSVYDVDTSVSTLSANNVLIPDVEYNTVYTINLYLYFDGEDTNCYTDNLPDTLNDYSIGITFKLNK